MKVAFRKSFERDLRKIRDNHVLQDVRAAIEQVEATKTLHEVKNIRKLTGSHGFYRIKVGDYRIGLSRNGDDLEFVRCLNRRDIYKHFP